MATPGTVRGRAPVATMICLARTVVVVPSWAFRLSVEASFSVPVPRRTSILFFFMRYSTPLEILSAIERLRAMTFAKSIRTLSTEIPHSSDFRIMVRISAFRRSAFVGMHPQFRQTPPRRSRSTTAADMPSWAALMAAVYPPGPAPRTRISNCLSAIAISKNNKRGNARSLPLSRRRGCVAAMS